MFNVGHSLIRRGELFQSLPPIIDNTFCPKVVRLHCKNENVVKTQIFKATYCTRFLSFEANSNSYVLKIVQPTNNVLFK